MNPFEQAMRMELEAEKFYKNMAEKTSDSKLKGLLIMLADEETKHYKTFEKMSKNLALGDVASFDIQEVVKKVFSSIKEEKKRYNFSDEQVALYKKAAIAEDRAYEFYLQKAQEIEDEAQKQAFLAIAKEEKKHQELLENLADFVESPSIWLESAEFYRIIEE